MTTHGLRDRCRPAGRAAAAALAATVLLLAGCGDSKQPAASQTAAKVNKDEITVHQINHVLQQRRLSPEQADAASRQVLERLIDQQLALQQAEELKLDREPRVVLQLEAARREIIARAYMDKLGEDAAKPTPEEVQRYYDDKPALFKERRIYNLHEIAVEARPDQLPALRGQLAQSKNIGEFVEYLKANDYRYAANQAVRGAEQLPLQSLDTFARMKDGQTLLTPNAAGATVIVLAGSRSQPVGAEQARPAIEQFLLNERKRQRMQESIKAMRANAKIEYVGSFAKAPAAAASAAAVPPAAPADVPALPASAGVGLTASEINKGMGFGK